MSAAFRSPAATGVPAQPAGAPTQKSLPEATAGRARTAHVTAAASRVGLRGSIAPACTKEDWAPRWPVRLTGVGSPPWPGGNPTPGAAVPRRLRAAQVGQHREHAPVVLVRRGQAELDEDRRDVALD